MHDAAALTGVEVLHGYVNSTRRGGQQWMRIQKRHFNCAYMLIMS
jgi:hypothetical protein